MKLHVFYGLIDGIRCAPPILSALSLILSISVYLRPNSFLVFAVRAQRHPLQLSAPVCVIPWPNRSCCSMRQRPIHAFLRAFARAWLLPFGAPAPTICFTQRLCERISAFAFPRVLCDSVVQTPGSRVSLRSPGMTVRGGRPRKTKEVGGSG